MRPLLHPTLINGRTGDPALYIETLFEQRAILFDLGDITSLSPRKIRRLEHVFVSHAHIDHFFGFDRMLRVLVGREKQIHLHGPEGFVDQVHHKLAAYRWNLVDREPGDLAFVVTEIAASLATRTVRFRLKTAFAAEAIGTGRIDRGILVEDPAFRVSTAVLDHRTPCLGFAIAEPAHLNVWKTRLASLGLPVGPWLSDLKRAVVENRPDDFCIRIRASATSLDQHDMPLEKLREVLTVTPGQKIGYVTDVADTADNRRAIVELVKGADLLFIESAFAKADVALATERAHLTTEAAGQIARQAGVRRVEPFHFSHRYAGEDERMQDEVMAAFAGQGAPKRIDDAGGRPLRWRAGGGTLHGAAAKGRQEAIKNDIEGTRMAATRIDCDIHPAVGGTRTTLLPYLDDHWKEQVVRRAIIHSFLPLYGLLRFARNDDY